MQNITAFPMKTCVVCHEQWQPRTSQQSAKNVTCSKECSSTLRKQTASTKEKAPKAAKKFPMKTCVVCRQKWQPEDRYQSARNVTCSKECSSVLVSKARTGKTARATNRISLKCPVCDTDFERVRSHALRACTPVCSKKCNGYYRGKEWGKHSTSSQQNNEPKVMA